MSSTALEGGGQPVGNRQATAPEGQLASVIIPNYNHGRFLPEAIRSALDQDYDPVEVVVVDDGSTEDTDRVVAPFRDRIHYLKQPNRGLSAARNAGFRQARGTYVSFLDADDLYEPNFLSTLIEKLRLAPDVAAIYAAHRFVDPSNRPLPQLWGRVIPPADFHQTLLDGNFLVPEAVLAYRWCYEAEGLFDEKLDSCEDWDMWLRLSRRYTIVGTDDVLTRHRVLPGSMSSDPSRMLRNRLAVLAKHCTTDGGEESIRRERRARGRAHLRGVAEYLQQGEPQRAYECFRDMVTTCPELVEGVDPFYELACGAQPTGYRGDFASLDLDRGERNLLDFLGRLFGEKSADPAWRSHRRAAYGNAFLALGLLCYGARHLPQSRRFLWKAVKEDRDQAMNPQLVSTLLRGVILEIGLRLGVWEKDRRRGCRR